MAYYAQPHENSQLVLLDSNAFGPKAVLKCSKMIEAFLGSVGNWVNWQLQTGKPLCCGWRPAGCFKNGRNLRKQTCTPCWIEKYLLYACVWDIYAYANMQATTWPKPSFCVSCWVWAQFLFGPMRLVKFGRDQKPVLISLRRGTRWPSREMSAA